MSVLHRERGGTNGITPKRGVVVHDSEGGEGGRASANLLAYMAAAGDRPNGRGGFYGSGYNAVATEEGGYTECAGADRAPYHAPPLNATWWSICIPGKAGQTRADWLDGPSRAYIRGVACYIVDKWREDGESWPLVYRSAAELAADQGGYTSHWQVSLAWGRTNHTDPGPQFPWDVLAADIAALTVPVTRPDVITPEEDDMIIVDYGYPGVDKWWTRCVIAGGTICWVQGKAQEWFEPNTTVPRRLDELADRHIQVENDQHFKDLLATFKATTKCPSTFAGNHGLSAAWAASRAR